MNPKRDYTPLTVMISVNYREAQVNGNQGLGDAGKRFIKTVIDALKAEYPVRLVGEPHAPNGMDFQLMFERTDTGEPEPPKDTRPRADKAADKAT